MHYNSIDHFLTIQQPAIIALMAAAQREAGGHYAALTPDALEQNAANDGAEFLTNMRRFTLDSTIIQGFQAGAQENVLEGVDLSDLIRMDQAVERRFCELVEQELRDQADLAADLIRRIHHLTGRFRSTLTGVQVDQTLKRLRKK